MSMILPGVVGFKLFGKLLDGVTTTDLVLTVTQMLRKHGVIGKFIEFYNQISPPGSIHKDSPAAKYLIEHGVDHKDFNSYGRCRGNHEVMVRGTFANIRLVNKLMNGEVGPKTVHIPTGEKMTVYDAAMRYKEADQDTIILAWEDYGTGSSRDWAAKGPLLLVTWSRC